MTVLPDDHENKWQYQGHTKAKHEVLRYYLAVWARIVSDPNYKIRIFDCFAGRGEYLSTDGTDPFQLRNIKTSPEYPGSPQIILDVLTGHNHLFKEAEVYFIEANKENRKALQKNIDETTGVPENVQPKVASGEFADVTQELVAKSGGRRGFAFFFMDPFGLNLDYDVVTNLTGTPRFDGLITLMTKELIRWQNSDKHDDSFTKLFGTENWKEELENIHSDQLTYKEAEYYCERLEDNGPAHSLAYMTTRSDNRSLVYHLVFTTNNPKGMEAMKESMMRCGTDYTLAYAPNRGKIHGGQTTLQGGQFMTQDDVIKSYILTKYAGKTSSFEDIATELVVDNPYMNSLKKDYRRTIKELDNEGLVDIPDRANEDDPLPPLYKIHFPEQS